MIRQIFSMLLLSALAACAGGYVQPPTSGPHAILKIHDIIESGHELTNVLRAVDGELVNTHGSIAVTPGPHRILLRGYETPLYNMWTPYRQAEVTLEAKAGETYRMELGTDDEQRLMVRLVDARGRAASDSARFMRYMSDAPYYGGTGVGIGIGSGIGGGFGVGAGRYYGYPYYP